MVTCRFSLVKFKKLPCELLFPGDETCHFPEMTREIYTTCVITQDVIVELPISWIILVPRVIATQTSFTRVPHTLRLVGV